MHNKLVKIFVRNKIEISETGKYFFRTYAMDDCKLINFYSYHV